MSRAVGTRKFQRGGRTDASPDGPSLKDHAGGEMGVPRAPFKKIPKVSLRTRAHPRYFVLGRDTLICDS